MSSLGAQGIAPAPPLTPATVQATATDSTTKNLTTLKTPSRPFWKDLTKEQQLSLEPLASNWNLLEEAQKRKWVAIAANYPALAPAEQIKLHSRMTEWVSLSYQQRAQARLNFAQTKQLTPTEKTATWQAYQALSPEEKQKLVTLPPPKLSGAAIASKPVSPQKLATVPVNHQSLIEPNKIATASQNINRNTLLPHPMPPTEPVVKQKTE